MPPITPISVVIPLYNKEREIRRALDSVLAQSSAVNEIIVVDDGSSDSGPEIVEKYFRDRVVLLTQKNAGVSAARNLGIASAAAPFVCLLDADDEWLPEYIEEIRKLMATYPDAAFYSCNRCFQDEFGRLIPSKLGLDSNYFGLVQNFPKIYANGYGLVCSSSVCIRKRLHDEGLVFPEGEKLGEDIYYWLKTSMRGRLAFSARVLSKVHLDAQSRSTSLNGIVPYHVRWFLERRKCILKDPGGKYIRQFIISNALVITYGMAQSGRKDSVRVLVRQFFLHKQLATVILLPALFLPRNLLGLIKRLRRWLR